MIEEIKIRKQARKDEIVEHLLKLPMSKIRNYVNEYSEESEVIQPETIRKEVSDWWYLVPFLFSIIGGLIAYAANNVYDEEKARKLLGFGFFMTIFWVILIVGVILSSGTPLLQILLAASLCLLALELFVIGFLERG